MTMAWHITFVKGDLAGKSFDIGARPVMVGRYCEVGIPIPRTATDVSRHHLVLTLTDKGVELTNSSSHPGATYVGTRVVPPSHRTMLQAGDYISLGMSKGTQFILEEGEAKTSSGVEGEVPTGSVTECANSITRGVTKNGSEADLTKPEVSRTLQRTATNTVKSRPTNTFDENGPETRPIETVYVDQADIDKLIKELILAQKRKIFWRVFLFVLAFFAVAAAYYFLQPRPEKVLSWPRRDDGRYDVHSVQLETPFGAKALWLTVPGGPYLASTKDTNGVVRVTTRLGKQRDVPFWVTFSCETNRDAVTQNRIVLFEKKKRQLAATGSWNFQASTPTAFLGADNGLPYLGAQYLRSVRKGMETEQRYGHLLFAVWGDKILTLLREIPAVEQWRGGAILSAEPLLNVERGALEARWEGRTDYRDEPVESMLSEADALLASKASMRWQEVEFLLQSVLIKSVLQTGSEAQKTHEKSLERLRDLRQKERLEYSRLKGEWEKSKRLGDADGCRNTLGEALKIFSVPDDKRNAFFLKGGWK